MRNQLQKFVTRLTCLIFMLNFGCNRPIDQFSDRPSGRGYHAMAYDRESRRVILFGGQTGNPTNNLKEVFKSDETWAFDPESNRWQEMLPKASPPGMSANAIAYDCESDRIIIHGGAGTSDNYEDWVLYETWAYDFNNNTWARMADGPPRLGHRMAYDSESDRIIMFSGASFIDGRFLDVQETWAYDFNSDLWVDLNPRVSPPPRHYHGMAYDRRSDRVIMWGGFWGR